MTPLRVAFAGTPEFALRPLQALAESRHEIVGVLTQPDRPAGRGRHLTASPVKREAVARGWPIDQPVTLKIEPALAALKSWRPDVLVVVAYGLILPPAVLEIPRLGCVNIHASLLPRWRGAAPIQRAILEGDAQTGVSIMRMDAGLDTGPVFLQRYAPIDAAVTAGELQERLATLGAQALLEVLAGLAAGTMQAAPQPAFGATYARKIEKAEALIDWRCDAAAVARQVRAFHPWPIAETRHGAGQLRIHRAAALRELPAALTVGRGMSSAPGTVLGLHEEALCVACGDGVLAVQELQRPGRKAVSAREFARGAALETMRFG